MDRVQSVAQYAASTDTANNERPLKRDWFYWFIAILTATQLPLSALFLLDFVLHPLESDYHLQSNFVRWFSTLVVVPVLVFIALLVIRRAPRNLTGLCLLLWVTIVISTTARQNTNLQILQNLSFGWVGMWVLPLYFPDGRAFPRRFESYTRLLCVGLVLSLVVWGFSAPQVSINEASQLPNPLFITALEGLFPVASATGQVLIIAILVIILPSLIARYRGSNQLVRQQLKWLVWVFFGIVLSTIPMMITGITTRDPQTLNPLEQLILSLWSAFITFAPFFAISIAMLRYRLWEVDVYINRSLVYGGLTLALGAVFLGGFFFSQSLLQALIGGEQSTIAIAAPTAIIVALFNPTRRRIQTFVDRRFYHLRVDLIQLAEAQKPKVVTNPGALSGTKLGTYEVGEVLGRGGMGEVYKGHQTGLDRTVAIKILPPELAKNIEFRARFEREAKTVASLRHPNIVHVFDFGNAANLYYMVMEFIDGQELGHYLREHGAIPLDTAYPMIRDIASALDYAHEQGLVHRDVKPSNVMLQEVTSIGTGTSHQRAILMDFGITKLVTGSTGLTQTGGMMGTLDYMAPEQIMSAKEVDKRADVYALGVMAYQILTGQLPFKNEGLGQLLFAHLQQPAPDPRDLLPDLSLHVAKAVMKALAKKPDERFQTAGEFVIALG